MGTIEIRNRKTNGEVFTPPSLAEQMINSLPDESLIIDRKYLDPCAGATMVFPIMLMFRYVDKFGKEYIRKYLNECLHICEYNALALEYGKGILMRYALMLKTNDVEIVKKHYFDNFEAIVYEFYQYSEMDEV